jgi:hypothetical protein
MVLEVAALNELEQRVAAAEAVVNKYLPNKSLIRVRKQLPLPVDSSIDELLSREADLKRRMKKLEEVLDRAEIEVVAQVFLGTERPGSRDD